MASQALKLRETRQEKLLAGLSFQLPHRAPLPRTNGDELVELLDIRSFRSLNAGIFRRIADKDRHRDVIALGLRWPLRQTL